MRRRSIVSRKEETTRWHETIRTRSPRTGSLAALALSLAAPAGCGGGEETSTTSTTPQTTSTYEDPPELQPGADGAYELRFGPSEVEIDGQRFCLRAYNGMTSGPTIRIPKGEDRRRPREPA